MRRTIFRRVLVVVGTMWWGSGVVGCESRAPEPAASAGTKTLEGPSPPEPRSVGAVPVATTASERIADWSSRLVAIGDLHGDFASTRAAFRLVGAVDESDKWVGGSLIVVQTGDQLDRGDQEREILEFLDRIALEAQAQGGKVWVLNGNHEIMNAMGDYRYVTPAGFLAFDDVEPKASGADRYPTRQKSRAAAFLPGGGEALRLAKRPIVVQVRDTIFVHGGVRPPHVDYGFDRLNRETTAWLRGESALVPRLLADVEGPIWTRIYGDSTLDAQSCAVLAEALKKAKARRMVVGHTVQERGVSSACNDQVFRIDVGLSDYYGGTDIQALELLPEGHRVLKAPKTPVHP